VVIGGDAGLLVVPMRWQLIPPWWKKSLKELPATFNAEQRRSPRSRGYYE